MPNIKSAKKRVKTDAVKKVRNNTVVASMRTAVKKARTEVKNGNHDTAEIKVKDAVKKIDKALSRS